ncbi:TIGR01777 family oxidoreductase [Vibrio sp.]|uniref:TIGR01777 family protein n=1 Tax=Vibrio viridaestus TaxID=2487322 RepID=A0A3N9TZT4_9VIBR|nr:TIGR01777 family oxidoreductase [Vibrio viridaestus]MDC0611605.1 TIGR01777 family oxidoreductase [Vibrio sp.]RQW62482.1 TIGR01777 family protein [Vibrio viridaestus]
MKILVTGGTGLIGSALLKLLSPNDICVVTRNISKAKSTLRHLPSATLSFLDDLQSLSDLNNYDVVINLAGEPIADKRWSNEQKERICNSRWDITKQLVSLIHASTNPPTVFISGSAVGYYGDQQSHPFDESLRVHNNEFAHKVCIEWEKIALNAASDQTRVCLLRTGVVLSAEGGALKKMLLPYQWGLGSSLGNGEQYFPWIHIRDMVKAILFLMNTDYAHGPFNLCAPHPVTNKCFSQSLAHSLNRPHFLKTPQWLISMVMGESSKLLFDSARAKPKALTDLGFTFDFPRLRPALDDILRNHK